MKNKIEDLRNHLFATLEALQDKEDPMPIERAKAIAEVGKVLVSSAKVEVEFLKAIGADEKSGTGFIDMSPKPEKLPDGAGGIRLIQGAAQSGSK